MVRGARQTSAQTHDHAATHDKLVPAASKTVPFCNGVKADRNNSKQVDISISITIHIVHSALKIIKDQKAAAVTDSGYVSLHSCTILHLFIHGVNSLTVFR